MPYPHTYKVSPKRNNVQKHFADIFLVDCRVTVFNKGWQL